VKTSDLTYHNSYSNLCAVSLICPRALSLYLKMANCPIAIIITKMQIIRTSYRRRYPYRFHKYPTEPVHPIHIKMNTHLFPSHTFGSPCLQRDIYPSGFRTTNLYHFLLLPTRWVKRETVYRHFAFSAVSALRSLRMLSPALFSYLRLYFSSGENHHRTQKACR
jgi:hypothetical protein